VKKEHPDFPKGMGHGLEITLLSNTSMERIDDDSDIPHIKFTPINLLKGLPTDTKVGKVRPNFSTEVYRKEAYRIFADIIGIVVRDWGVNGYKQDKREVSLTDHTKAHVSLRFEFD